MTGAMLLRSYILLLAVTIVVLLDYSHCTASSGSNTHASGGGFQNDPRRSGDIENAYDAQYQDSSLQDYGDRKLGDESSLPVTPARSFGDAIRWNNPQKIANIKGKFVRFVSVICPKRALTPRDESLHANLYFHIPNRPREVVIREAKPGGMWRREDLDYLVAKGFDANKQTLIYLGGWMQRNKEFWLKSARKTFDRMSTKNGGEAPFNLLIFDGADYTPLNYGKAVAFVPHVGKVLANLIEQLIVYHNLKAELVHLISYSLSTHIAGIGARLVKESGRGVVGQITAIDPTGVCFHRNHDNIFDIEYSLKPTDAKLVVTRHYNIGRFGSGRLIGGLDILVNGGRKQHFMRPQRRSVIEFIGYSGYATGAHARASQHEEAPFTVQPDCHEIAYECSDYSKFKMGQCADCGHGNMSCFLVDTLGSIMLDQRPTEVGYKPGTQMHISTGFDHFCAYHYQVVAQLKPNPSDDVLRAFAKGKFRFKLDAKLLVKPKYLLDEDGIKFTRLMRLDRKIEQFPDQIDVSKLDRELLDSLESVSINFMSHISAERRARGSFRYCPDKSGKLLLENCLKTLRRLLQEE